MRNLLVGILLFLYTASKAQDLSKLYETVRPSVVVIFTEEMKLEKQGATVQMVSSQSLGSGFLISDTEILTAAHVVDVAEQLLVQFSDGEIIEAKVVSSFKNSDIALIALTAPKKNPVIAALGDSDKSKVGERIVVIGAPFGLSHSLSSGYISGFIKNTDDQNPFTNAEYIQTDAAINTGNSGGPMFNLEGEVIGIVSHIKTITGGFQGIGFAASSNIAKKLLLDRKILWTGAEVIPLSGESAKMLNVPQNDALLVQRVVSNSPYGKMGLRGGTIEATIEERTLLLGGDIILAVNGIRFEFTDETLTKLGDFANALKPGDPIVLEILRDGKVISLRN
ncbi:trypsin-like peptidase domain-containing protein [Flavobacteriaceae bacterium 3-367]|uniref:S1C family serine protease n=1 Tax=Eudoraea algarum TaxID=3417568 RepID=UPI003280274C